jgi:hypothetical protein
MRRSLALVALALALWPAVAQAAQPTEAPLAYHLPDGGYDLGRLDPLTLAPLGPQADINEWHMGYSVSPDGGRIATTISHPGLPGTPGSGRVGLRIYDLTTFDVVREFRTGGATQAVGWLTPRRVVAASRQVFVADPVDGSLETTDTVAGPGCGDPHAKAVTRSRLVFLLGSTLNVVDREGDRRHVTLRDMSNDCGRLGLAVDQARELVYVVGVGGEVAVVRPQAMRTTYVRVGPSRATRVDSTSAHHFGAFQLAAAHRSSRGMPRGVELVNTFERARRMVDPRAGAAQVYRNLLLTYDGRDAVSAGGSRGIRMFNTAGRLRDRLLKREVVHDVDIHGRFAYARTRGGLRVIDLETRDVASRSAFDPDSELEFVVPGGAGR